MKRIFTHLFVAVLLMLSTTSWAQVQPGKVYNFVNREYGKSMSCVERDRAVLATTDNDDYFQLWYVADGGDGTYTLRNLGNGYYLKGNGSGSKWPFVADASAAKLYYRELSSDYCTFDADNSDNGNEMHYGNGNGCVVGWSSSESASQWTATLVDVSESALAANWAAIDAIDNASSHLNDYSVLLENMFEDASCTVLKSPYRSYSDSQFNGDDNYSNLPAVLQAMVKKVRDSSWGEENVVGDKPAWDSDHSKRFRVQLYEPYSYAERTANMLGISAHTNMNNPTGIVANARDVLYVMVEDDVPEGAALYIQAAVDRERIGNVGGVQLQKGLNIIPYWGDDNQIFIHYVVDTYNNGAKTGYELTDYAPLKIHIEGGCINGCFDTVGDALNAADTEDDWNYYEERASQYNFTVMGKYVMWHMPLNLADEPYDPNGYKTYDLSVCLGSGATSVFDAMATWEALESAQRLAEGLLSADEIAKIRYASGVFEYTGNDEFYPSDYSKVFNNRSLAYSTVNEYYMFAGDKATHYAAYTLKDVIRDIPTSADPWGPSHEIGHTYQGPIQLPSTSETSNNALANISNYFMSRTSSRLGSMQELLAQFNNKTSYLGVDANSSNVWDKLMMYTKLWLYYHVAGNNKKFYPRLCEMFRRDPIERTSTVTGTGTMLKFYKYACMAAEEDLTDFFAAFGFFVPVDGVHSDDYAQYKTIMTQAEIDAAKAEVAAMAKANEWKKNTTILFIDDRIGDVVGADGKTVLALRGDGGKENGALGSINDYDQNPGNDVAPLNGTYSYSITGSTMTMSGATGGTGFVIYDADGNLVSFSNTYSFPLSEEAQAALATGEARVVVVKSDNSTVEIEDVDATQTQINLLQGLLGDVAELLSFEDDTETKVGWFKPAALSSLKAAYAQALEVYDGVDVAAFAGVYNLLYDEFNTVATSRAAKVWFSDGRTYSLKNVDSGAYMKNDGTNVKADNTSPTASSASYLWYLQEGSYYEYYKVKNSSTGQFVQHHGNNNNNVIYTLGNAENEFEIKEVSYGKFTIYEQGHKRYLNYQSGDVKTWEGNGAGSQWEITFIPTDETMAERANLEELMLQAQELMDVVGTAELEKYPLQGVEGEPYWLYCNAPNTNDVGTGEKGNYVKNLTDGNTNSHLHTIYSGNSVDGENHYLRVDLGQGNEVSVLRFAYATRNSSNLDMPSRMLVQGSNSPTTDYVTLAELTSDDANPLPTEASKVSWYKSTNITTGQAYQYYRFMVTETKRGLKDDYSHYTFTMSEFEMYKPRVELHAEYASVDGLCNLLETAFNECLGAQDMLARSTVASDELQTAYNRLYDAYNELLTAKNAADAEKLNTYDTTPLETLINDTGELVNSCIDGEITVTPGMIPIPVTLQGTESSAAYYLYCNALHQGNDSDSSDNTGKLLDGDTGTYLHTAWKGDVAEPHYLLLDLGEGNSVSKFNFSYTTRGLGENEAHPKTIKIQGSTDNSNFEDIATIGDGLPNGSKLPYNSGELGNGKAYRYIRFTVTETYLHSTKPQSGMLNGHVFFYMSEFGFIKYIGTLSATLNNDCGEATEAMVLDAYRAMMSAKKLLEVATSAEQLQTAYSVLEAAYTVLNEAKNAVNKAALETAVQNAGTMLGTVTTDGVVNDRYSDAETVVAAIEALNNAVDAAQEVLDAVQTTQDAIDTAKGNVETAMSALQIELDKDVPAGNRTTLNTLLIQTTGLVNEIATVSTEETVIPLQCDNSDNDYYIWTNAQQPGDDNHIRNLLDTDAGTMFHSSWGNGATNVNEKHYLAIDLGKSSIKEFVFNYTTPEMNTAWWSYCPTDITVQGSNDFVEFTDIRQLTTSSTEPDKPLLDTTHGEDYVSNVLNAEGAYYRYLRFVVNGTKNGGKFNEQYFFQLATFGVTSKGTTIAINGNYALSNVTADMVSAAYSEAAAVAEIAGKYMTQKQYNDACTSLQAVYTALENAKNINKATLEQALAAAIAQRETLIDVEGNLDEYWTTSTALVQAFEELNSKTETAQKVFNSKTSTQKEIDDAATVLNSAVTALQNIINLDYVENDVVSRDDLRDLIAASTSLLEQVTTGEAAQFVPQELVTALEAKKNEAAGLVERYMTESDYNTLLQALQNEYNALNDALPLANSKVELKKLVDATMLLKNNLYEIGVASYTATEVTLQCETEGNAGYLYCNAPELDSYWSSDNAGVAGCIDLTENGEPDLETFLHTEYYDGDQSSDGLDHYLRVDLGEGGATKYVEFGYVGRSGHVSKSPETVIIAATDDLTGEWTTIKTLTMAEPSATDETKTGALGNGVAYRYWRFMVTDTHFNGTDSNKHPYFALSDFNVYKCTDVVLDSQLKSEYTPNIHMYTTAELVAEVEGAINDANTVCNDANTTIDDCNSEKEALQAEYDKLAEAIEFYWTPVKLTTDETAPVLYTINAPGRSDANNSKAWQYNAQNNNITIVNKDDTNLYHLWYFIEGDEEHTVKIVPVMTPEYTLGATEFGDAVDKVHALSADGLDWSFVYLNNNVNYNLKPSGHNTFLSHFKGGFYALGFYNNSTDNGSYFSFTPVELENYTLARLAKLADSHSTVVAGDKFGCFTVQSANPYNEAVDAATALVETNSTDNAACVSAFTALYESSKNLELLLPEDETVLCTITNVARTGGKMFANGETEPVLRWDNNAVTAKYIFTFEPTGEKGKYYMKSLERGTYISTAFGHGGGVEYVAADKDAAIIVTIANMSPESRAISITPVGGAMLHADASGNANKVVAWNENNATDASAWLLDEVTDLSQVTHTVTLGANESGADKNAYSTLYLAYNAQIPSGVTASIVEDVNELGQLVLTEVTGGVLPANTAVVLSSANAGAVDFKYTANEATFNPQGNELRGAACNELVLCGDDYNVYMLGKKSGRVAFYWTYENRGADGNYVYINANEEIVESTAAGAHKNHNKGGYVKCNANKAYLLESENPAQAAAAMYSFFFGGETTDLDEANCENGEVKTIYDLQGRKLLKVTSPGLYIVNGKKVYVTEIEE